MRLLFAFVLLIGVGLAGFAVYMAQGFISQTTAQRDALLAAQRAAIPTVEIFAVNKSKEYGTALTKDDVTKILWQKDRVPEGAFTELEQLFPEDDARRIVLRAFEKYEPVLQVKVTEVGEDAGLTSRLGKGFRALAIKVDVSSGVSGFLRPGDRVDIFWTGTADNRRFTRLIATKVELIAVDQISNNDRLNPVIARTVTIKGTREEVASLLQAQSSGRLSLSLVGAEEVESEGEEAEELLVEVDQKSLLGIVEQKQEVVEAPEECFTKVRRGAQVIEQKIPCTN